MSLSSLLNNIRILIYRIVFPGDYGGFIAIASNFISTHPLILFFVLCFFLFISISVIRRLFRL